MESSELRRALLQACSDTVQVAVCVSSDTARHAAALALVFWKSGGRVRIEVGSKDAPGGQTWTSREIEFSPKDAPLERWRSAGYAAGTLASLVVRGDRSGARTTAPSQAATEDKPTRESEAPAASVDAERTPEAARAAATSEKAEPKPAEPPPPTPEPATARENEQGEGKPDRARTDEHPVALWRWAFDGAGVYGSGIGGNNRRFGGLVRMSRAFGGPFVTASVGYSHELLQFSGIDVTWISPSVGLGYAIQLGRMFEIEARAEVVAELLHASFADQGSGERGSGNQWLGGGRLGVGFAWTPFDAVSLLVGGAVSARGPETDVFVEGELRAGTPISAAQLEAGLRFTAR